jgi:intein/homing endonuclease
MRKIKDIKVGDKVICHDSNLHKVTNVFKRDYEGDLICIKASGLTTIKVTPEHPILINRPHVETTYIHNDKTEEKIGGLALLVKPTKVRKTHFDTMWIKAKDIQLKDRLLLPNELFETGEIKLPKWEDNPKCLRKPDKIDKPDKDLAWLFGLYIADGNSVKSHRICITLGLNEMKYALKVKEIIKSKLGLKTSILVKKNCLRVMIYSSILANSFKEWFGGGKLPKKIPEFMFYGWGKECLEQLIDGIYCGDGHDHRDRKEIVNSSKELIYQIQYILSCLGKNPAIRKPKQTGYAKITKCKTTYLISWMENQDKNHYGNRIKHQGYYLSTGVYKIDKEHYSGKVYNFEVEDKNSYIADGILVHNCMAHIGCDDSDWAYQKYGGILGLIANSWGPDWNDGPKRNDQPDGSFWVRPAIVQKLINAGGAFALASVRGYNRELVYDMAGSVASLSKD